jgi:hypothetical protein
MASNTIVRLYHPDAQRCAEALVLLLTRNAETPAGGEAAGASVSLTLNRDGCHEVYHTRREN